jgi:hypothetical protein
MPMAVLRSRVTLRTLNGTLPHFSPFSWVFSPSLIPTSLDRNSSSAPAASGTRRTPKLTQRRKDAKNASPHRMSCQSSLPFNHFAVILESGEFEICGAGFFAPLRLCVSFLGAETVVTPDPSGPRRAPARSSKPSHFTTRKARQNPEGTYVGSYPHDRNLGGSGIEETCEGRGKPLPNHRTGESKPASVRTYRGPGGCGCPFVKNQAQATEARSGGRSPQSKDAEPEPDFNPILEESS